ncbi:MAG: hypothetical protein WCK67_09230 [bacterium]
MRKKITHIPTLQTYNKRRKKARNTDVIPYDCNDCNYFRSEVNVCLFGNTIRSMTEQCYCPISYQVFEKK